MIIQYLNQASITTLRRLERWLPVTAEPVRGSSIDIFHLSRRGSTRSSGEPNARVTTR